MIAIVEDSNESILGKFFNSGVVKDQIIFAKSNSNLVAEIMKVDESEDIIIFLDINPWNRQLFSLYQRIYSKLENTRGRAIILPIVCAEYNLLLSLKSREVLIKDMDLYKLVFDKENGGEFRKYSCRSYEKFCKYVLDTGVVDKVSTLCSNNPNHLYYTDENCDLWSVEKRLLEFYKHYRVVPINFKLSNSNKIEGFEEVYNIHCYMVEEYNKWAKVVNSSNLIRVQKYDAVFGVRK